MDLDLDHWRFGGGATQTVLHPLVLVTMIIAIIGMLLLPSKFRIPMFLFATFLIPSGQQVLVGGVHVFVYRLIVLAGLIGYIATGHKSKGSLLAGGWNWIDRAFLLCIAFHAVAYCLLYQESAAVVNQFGYIWDYAGGYLLLRFLVRNDEDVTKVIKCFAVLTLILAICMIREQMTGENIFGILGGVRFKSEVREGRIRSEAVFQHAILAGTFAAALMPLFVWLWKSGKAKLLSACGLIASVVMTLTTACSTPILAYGAGVFAICFWPLRRNLRLFRWGLVIALISLHLVMKAPVWALIERVDLVQGSSSYHRYQLVNQFIVHAGDWLLLGTKSNADWGAEMIDTSNAYVEEGTGGGILTLTFFVIMIACAFRRLGVARKMADRSDHSKEWFFWLLGSSLFVHITAFFGIYYFDQTRVAWFALLAMISAATSVRALQPLVKPPVKPNAQPRPIPESTMPSESHVSVGSRLISASPWRRAPLSLDAGWCNHPDFRKA